MAVFWTATSCASQYEVYVEANLTEHSYVHTSQTGHDLGDLLPCTPYRLQVFALGQQDQRSHDSASSRFTTGPRTRDLEDGLDLELEVEAHSMNLTMYLTEEMDCVEEVLVSLCRQEECEVVEDMESSEEVVFYSRDDLLPGTDYTLRMAFYYLGEVVGSQERLLVTPLDLSGLQPSAAVVGEEVTVTWGEVEGAGEYLVYRQYTGQPSQLVSGGTDADYTEEGNVTLRVTDQLVCSSATYLVQATRAGLEHQVGAATDLVTLLPNTSLPYRAEDLLVTTEGSEGTHLEWRHRPCVHSYTVVFRTKDMKSHEEQVVILSSLPMLWLPGISRVE